MSYEKFSEKMHRMLDQTLALAGEMPDGERESYETEAEMKAVIRQYMRMLHNEIAALVSEAEEDAGVRS